MIDFEMRQAATGLYRASAGLTTTSLENERRISQCERGRENTLRLGRNGNHVLGDRILSSHIKDHDDTVDEAGDALRFGPRDPPDAGDGRCIEESL